MPNRRLSPEELEMKFALLFTEVKQRLTDLSDGDNDLLWALRRKLFKELSYEERSKPMQRRKLKKDKRREQHNKCAKCGTSLPETYVVLDRLEAMKGYTQENTRVLCQNCDTDIQRDRKYK